MNSKIKFLGFIILVLLACISNIEAHKPKPPKCPKNGTECSTCNSGGCNFEMHIGLQGGELQIDVADFRIEGIG
ncbi:MAG TPA: hypothetical protein PLQ81_05540 [bacterium]|nr:hypothetical protein [bacterium]